MYAARKLCIVLGLAVSLFAFSPRSAGAQTVPDWPAGGGCARPANDVDRPVAAASMPQIDVFRLYQRLRSRISASSWLLRVQRPVGNASSALVIQRRAVK